MSGVLNMGRSIGSSLLEEDMVETCARLLDSDITLHLPSDLTGLGPGGTPMGLQFRPVSVTIQP